MTLLSEAFGAEEDVPDTVECLVGPPFGHRHPPHVVMGHDTCFFLSANAGTGAAAGGAVAGGLMYQVCKSKCPGGSALGKAGNALMGLFGKKTPKVEEIDMEEDDKEDIVKIENIHKRTCQAGCKIDALLAAAAGAAAGGMAGAKMQQRNQQQSMQQYGGQQNGGMQGGGMQAGGMQGGGGAGNLKGMLGGLNGPLDEWTAGGFFAVMNRGQYANVAAAERSVASSRRGRQSRAYWDSTGDCGKQRCSAKEQLDDDTTTDPEVGAKWRDFFDNQPAEEHRDDDIKAVSGPDVEAKSRDLLLLLPPESESTTVACVL